MLSSEFFLYVMKSTTDFISYQFIHRHLLKWLSGRRCVSFLPSAQCTVQVSLSPSFAASTTPEKQSSSVGDLLLICSFLQTEAEERKESKWTHRNTGPISPVQSSRRAFRSLHVHQRHENVENVPPIGKEKETGTHTHVSMYISVCICVYQ